MPIPPLNDFGRLLTGIYDAALDELKARFGGFQGSDQRVRLWAAFEQFVSELRRANLGAVLVINGSFVTSKSVPADIDLILVLPAELELARELSPTEYNVLSARRVRKRHGLDLLVARADSDQYHRYVRLFQQVRLEPGMTKGILRLKL